MKLLINSAPLVTSADKKISELLKDLSKVSTDCILVVDHRSIVIGLVTKSDLISGLAENHKPLDDILVSEIMSQQVEFVRYSHLNSDIIKVFKDMEYSHFPVIRTEGSPALSNLVGLINMADIAKYIFKNYHNQMEKNGFLYFLQSANS